jgi:hypothetical protein
MISQSLISLTKNQSLMIMRLSNTRSFWGLQPPRRDDFQNRSFPQIKIPIDPRIWHTSSNTFVGFGLAISASLNFIEAFDCLSVLIIYTLGRIRRYEVVKERAWCCVCRGLARLLSRLYPVVWRRRGWWLVMGVKADGPWLDGERVRTNANQPESIFDCVALSPICSRISFHDKIAGKDLDNEYQHQFAWWLPAKQIKVGVKEWADDWEIPRGQSGCNLPHRDECGWSTGKEAVRHNDYKITKFYIKAWRTRTCMSFITFSRVLEHP